MKLGTRGKGLCLLGITILLAGCGNKRPPAVATNQPRNTGGQRPQAVGDMPEVSPLDKEGAVGRDFSETGEGGPLADIHFEYDEAGLTDQAKATLDHHAQWLQAHAGVRVRIEGHCDERGTTEYNLALGDRRATAAREYLVSHGLNAGRVTTVSYGKERPLDPGRSDAAFARNRRDHFAVAQQP